MDRRTDRQWRAYLQGHRRNPLTTTLAGSRVLNAFQVPWFLLLPPRGFGVLTTTGRLSGKPRRRCVRAIRDGDRFFLVSLTGPGAAWFRNLKADPRVRLRTARGTLDGYAREITDPAELEAGRRVYAETVNRFDRLEYRMHRTGRPTAAKIREMHAKWYADGTPLVIERAALTE
jgi:deazaflavin-dependent oxidoreductase (nitroreductase family)